MAPTGPSPIAAFWTRSRNRVGSLAGGRGSADAHAVDKTEVAAQLNQELLGVLDESLFEVTLGMLGRKIDKLDEEDVLEDRRGVGVQFCHRRWLCLFSLYGH
jgi:hypothetical protein